MLLYLLALWVGRSREEVRSTLRNSRGVSHAELVMLLAQPGFCAGGNWRGKHRSLGRLRDAGQGAQGRQLNCLWRALPFHLAVRVKCRVSGRHKWKEGGELGSGAPVVGAVMKFRELQLGVLWRPCLEGKATPILPVPLKKCSSNNSFA